MKHPPDPECLFFSVNGFIIFPYWSVDAIPNQLTEAFNLSSQQLEKASYAQYNKEQKTHRQILVSAVNLQKQFHPLRAPSRESTKTTVEKKGKKERPDCSCIVVLPQDHQEMKAGHIAQIRTPSPTSLRYFRVDLEDSQVCFLSHLDSIPLL